MKRLVLLLTLNVAMVSSPLWSQCPMCKAALTSNRDMKGDSGPTAGDGINRGILFLLATPYVLVGTVGFIYYQNFKKKKAQRG